MRRLARDDEYFWVIFFVTQLVTIEPHILTILIVTTPKLVGLTVEVFHFKSVAIKHRYNSELNP